MKKQNYNSKEYKEHLVDFRDKMSKKTLEEARRSLSLFLYLESYEKCAIIKEMFGELEPITIEQYVDEVFEKVVKK